MAIQTIDRGTSGDSSDTFKIGQAFDVCQNNDDYLQSSLTSGLALKADINSPSFTGSPTAPTPLSGDNSTKLATTAFVIGEEAKLNVATFALLGATAATLDQVVSIKGHTAAGIGGGQFIAKAGSVTNDGGTKINSSTGGLYWQRSGVNSYTPQMFGAMGDDLTDDTAAWQGLVAAVSSIYGSSGSTYKVTDKITVGSNKNINLFGSRLKQYTDQREIFDVSNSTNVTITNGYFIGKSEATYINSSTSRSVAIKADAGNSITVSSNYFTNFYYSPFSMLVKGTHVKFIGNHVNGPSAMLAVDINRRNCTGISALADYLTISDNEIYGTAQGLIVAQGSSNVVIDGNIIHDIVNEHGMYIDTAVNAIAITNNVLYSCASSGIKVQYYTSFGGTVNGIVISNNVVSGCATGDGIIVYNVTPTGSPLYATGVVISGNTVRDITLGIGINVRYVNDVIITGNNIINCIATYGIYVAFCNRVRISNNLMRDIFSSGIYYTTNTDGEILNNSIRNSGFGLGAGIGGVYAAAAVNFVVSGNVIYGQATYPTYGLFLASGTQSTWSVMRNYVSGCSDYALRLGSSAALNIYQDNFLTGTLGSSFNEPALPSIASAAAVTLPTAQRFINITGTTTITSINTQGHSGSIVTLIFAGVLTVTRGSNLQIVSNFVTTGQDTLTVACDGSNWFEISRAVN